MGFLCKGPDSAQIIQNPDQICDSSHHFPRKMIRFWCKTILRGFAQSRYLHFDWFWLQFLYRLFRSLDVNHTSLMQPFLIGKPRNRELLQSVSLSLLLLFILLQCVFCSGRLGCSFARTWKSLRVDRTTVYFNLGWLQCINFLCHRLNLEPTGAFGFRL